MKKLFFALVSLIFFLTPFILVHASGFQVKTVGSLNVDGVTYDRLWYSSGNVTFTGITAPGEGVTATIDGTPNTAGVDADGNWSYSTSLAEGDHSIDFSSSAGSKSFTLTIGAVPEGVGALPAAETPTAGSVGPTISILSAGLVFILWGISGLVKGKSKA